MKVTMQQKLSALIAELGAFRETYKAEINAVPHSGTGSTTCEEDVDTALSALEDAMHEINSDDEEEAEEEDGDDYETHMKFECRQGNFI